METALPISYVRLYKGIVGNNALYHSLDLLGCDKGH